MWTKYNSWSQSVFCYISSPIPEMLPILCITLECKKIEHCPSLKIDRHRCWGRMNFFITGVIMPLKSYKVNYDIKPSWYIFCSIKRWLASWIDDCHLFLATPDIRQINLWKFYCDIFGQKSDVSFCALIRLIRIFYVKIMNIDKKQGCWYNWSSLLPVFYPFKTTGALPKLDWVKWLVAGSACD